MTIKQVESALRAVAHEENEKQFDEDLEAFLSEESEGEPQTTEACLTLERIIEVTDNEAKLTQDEEAHLGECSLCRIQVNAKTRFNKGRAQPAK